MMPLNTIYCGDCLDVMKEIDDNSIDLIFTDPPYALGSEVIIRPDGRPDYKKAVDFMNKWTQPDGRFWEAWFVDAMRILKYGGRVIMFGMDRQLMLNKYYACSAGFIEQMSLYWYFISNFPKAGDLGKALDKRAGAEREVIGETNSNVYQEGKNHKFYTEEEGNPEYSKGSITAPVTTLGKKYDGYRHSIAPLKQTNETIMVFQKPYKTGSCLHDTLAFEAGDHECLCGSVSIDGGRVPCRGNDSIGNRSERPLLSTGLFGGSIGLKANKESPLGRYPAQCYIDSGAAEVLDAQSGVFKDTLHARMGNNKYQKNLTCAGQQKTMPKGTISGFADVGGCSKILHVCEYDKEDFYIYTYCKKVGAKERGDSKHPTMKPLALLNKILTLFKTPNKQVVLDPFAGSGSGLVACAKLGIEFIGIELSEEYCQITEKRINSLDKTQTRVVLNTYDEE